MATETPTFFDWELSKHGQTQRAVDFKDGMTGVDTLDGTTITREIQIPGGGVARSTIPNAIKIPTAVILPAGEKAKPKPQLTGKPVAPVVAPTPDAAQQFSPPPGLEDMNWSEFAAAGIPKPTVGIPGAAPVAAPMPDSPSFVGPVQPIRDLSNGFVPPSPSPFAGRQSSRYRGRNQPEPRQTVDARALPRLANPNAWDVNAPTRVSGSEAGAGELFKRTGGRVRIARNDGGYQEVQGYTPGEFATNWVSTMKKFKLSNEQSGLQQMADAFKY